MKKVIWICVAIVIVAALVVGGVYWYNSSSVPSPEDGTQTESNMSGYDLAQYTEAGSGQYYKFYSNPGNVGREYVIQLLDEDGNVKLEQALSGDVQVTELERGAVDIRIKDEQGDTYDSFYYPTMSYTPVMYKNPLAIEHGKVVFFDSGMLKVHSIFNKNAYSEDIKRNFSPVTEPESPIQSVTFLDEDTIEVEYLEGEERTVRTEQIDLQVTEE